MKARVSRCNLKLTSTQLPRLRSSGRVVVHYNRGRSTRVHNAQGGEGRRDLASSRRASKDTHARAS